MPTERLLFLTGRLAEHALRRVIDDVSASAGLNCAVHVMPISVAALLHADWIRTKLPSLPEPADRVILPGWCQGDIALLTSAWNTPVHLGPKDLRDLPQFFGREQSPPPDLSSYNIEILAEINHAPRLSDESIILQAEQFRDSGADLIDLGCIPGETWTRAGEVTQKLRDLGFRLSIDTFNRTEAEAAAKQGAELLLSCNSSNRQWAADLGMELVVIPDDIRHVETFDSTIAFLEARQIKHRLDPIIEPIGFGFANSLGRYLETRNRFPQAAMMMGIGNLTELTETDSAGINFLLAGFCEELGIQSVLTTEVINWCRTSVREFDLARRIVTHAVRQRILPKHLDSRLVALRDPDSKEIGEAALAELAAGIKDPNFRLFAERGELHAINRDGHRHSEDPYELFKSLGPLDPSHAFYLGYELSKAVTALTLGKNYVQDEALNWGFLTRPEESARHRSSKREAVANNVQESAKSPTDNHDR